MVRTGLSDAEPHKVDFGVFQSPCAGNMFGKYRISNILLHANRIEVSIPVCGEHVW